MCNVPSVQAQMIRSTPKKTQSSMNPSMERENSKVPIFASHNFTVRSRARDRIHWPSGENNTCSTHPRCRIKWSSGCLYPHPTISGSCPGSPETIHFPS